MLRLPIYACLAVGFLTSSSAWAQEPKFNYASEDEKKAVEKVQEIEWKASANAGLILTSGNAKTTAVSGGMKASTKFSMNQFQIEAGGAYVRTGVFVALDNDGDGDADAIARDSTTTSRAWQGKGRYDRFLTDANSAYVSALIASDRPAGKELTGGGQAGYSRRVYKDDSHQIMAELGYDFSYEDLVVGNSLSIHSLRTFAGYTGKLSEDTGLDAAVEGLFNVNSLDTSFGEVDAFGDRRITGKLSVTTKILTDISLRFGFEAKHDSDPSARPTFGIPYDPAFTPRADELDTKTEASLIINFL